MPWIKEEKLYPIIALLLILIMALRTPIETDMWWHLRAGEETLGAREVYSIDTFSHTRDGYDWINHSWLSQIVMFLAFDGGGYYGISAWVGLCAALSMFFVYLQLKGHPLLKSAVLLFAAVVSSVVWSPRPQIHSLVLFSLVGYLIYRYKEKKSFRYLIWILPIFALWGNLHGGYVLGIILMGAFAVGEILNKVLFSEFAEDLTWRQIGVFVIFMLAGLVMVLINPFGLDMWRIPFNTVGVETLQNVINEWASPDFHQPFQQPMLWMMLGAFSLIGLSKKRIDGAELMPLIVFSWAALVARRNFGPFAIVAAPIVSKYLDRLLDDWLIIGRQRLMWIEELLTKANQSNKELKPWVKNSINLILIALLLVVVGWKLADVNRSEFVLEAERKIYPVDAVNWLEDSGITGKIFNDYNWGGYLIWHLRDHPVFVDGRTDLYGDEILKDYMNVISGKVEWTEMIEFYDIDILLIPPEMASADLIENSGFHIVYEDDTSVIFVK